MNSILEIIQPIKLLSGSHHDTATTGQGCAMNVIAYLNGEDQITDNSECVCVTIRKPLIWFNDFLNDNERQELIPFLLRAMGSATEDKQEIEKRVKHLVDFANTMYTLAKSYCEAAVVSKGNSVYNFSESAAYTYRSALCTKTSARSATAVLSVREGAINDGFTATYTTHVYDVADFAIYTAVAVAEVAEALEGEGSKLRSEIKKITFEFLDVIMPKVPKYSAKVFDRATVLAELCSV